MRAVHSHTIVPTDRTALVHLFQTRTSISSTRKTNGSDYSTWRFLLNCWLDTWASGSYFMVLAAVKKIMIKWNDRLSRSLFMCKRLEVVENVPDDRLLSVSRFETWGSLEADAYRDQFWKVKHVARYSSFCRQNSPFHFCFCMLTERATTNEESDRFQTNCRAACVRKKITWYAPDDHKRQRPFFAAVWFCWPWQIGAKMKATVAFQCLIAMGKTSAPLPVQQQIQPTDRDQLTRSLLRPNRAHATSSWRAKCFCVPPKMLSPKARFK